MRAARFVSVILMMWGLWSVVDSQDTDALTIEVEPNPFTLEVGEKTTLVATVRAADGNVMVDANVIFYSRARRSVSVTREGEASAHRAGAFTLIALVPRDPEDTSRRPDAIARIEIPVTVSQPRIETVAFVKMPPKFYVGTRPQLRAEATDALGAIRHDAVVAYTSGDTSISEVGSRSERSHQAADWCLPDPSALAQSV